MEICLAFLYAKYLMMHSGSNLRYLLLLIIILLFTVGGLILSLNTERNYISLAIGTILPILLFDAIIMGRYSWVIQLVYTIGGVCSISIAVFMAAFNTIKGTPYTKQNRLVIVKTYRHASVIFSFILLCGFIYGRTLISTSHRVEYKDINYSISDSNNDVQDYENSLAANIDIVTQLDPDGGWGSLSLEQKVAVLETIVRIECRYLGMQDSAPSLQIVYLQDGIGGQYDPESDVVSLSYSVIVDSKISGYYVAQVLCREMYHRYQHYQVQLLSLIKLNQDTRKYASLQILYEAATYEQEMTNLDRTSGNDVLPNKQTASTRLDQDAEKYANASIAEYYSRIQLYLHPAEP
jgi:hypothetical protein